MRTAFRLVLHLLVLTLTALPAHASTEKLMGCWEGVVTANGNHVRMLLEFNADGGDLHIFAGEINTQPIINLLAGDGSFTFDAMEGDVATNCVATLSANGDTLSGIAARGTKRNPFSVVRITGFPDNSAALGAWEGKLDLGNGQALKLVLKTSEGPCGRLFAVVDSPDQGANGMPVTVFSFQDGKLDFEMRYLKGLFSGTLSEGGNQITGQWTQYDNVYPPLTFNKLDEAPTYTRPQEPVPPFPYDSEEVTFKNITDDIDLAGTLTYPKGDGPFPAVVMITGSGAQDRDEFLLGHKPFLVIADHLTRNGIAVLRFDDRGVGGSGGNTYQSTMDNTAKDVIAGMALLTQHGKIDKHKIGLFGHSEGGWVSPIVANMRDDVAFIVMMAGPGVGGRELWLSQRIEILKQEKVSQAMIDVDQIVMSRVLEVIKDLDDNEEAMKGIQNLLNGMAEEFSGANAAAFDTLVTQNQANLESAFELMLTPWFRALMLYDAEENLAGMQCPVLALFGEKDIQVPAVANRDEMRRIFEASGHSDYQLTIMPGLNHLMQTCVTGSMAEYGEIDETVSPAVLQLVTDWITKRVQ